MQVYDKSSWLVSYSDVPKFRRSVIFPSMFPSGKGNQDLDNGNCNVVMEDDNTSVENGKTEDGVEALENPVTSESADEVSAFPLEHCMRILPHDQNTGAFFMAVLQKVSPLPAVTEKHLQTLLSSLKKNYLPFRYRKPMRQCLR